MDIGWNFRREHLRLQQRSHYVITNGGDQPNVVPPTRVGLVLLPRDRLRRTSRSCGRSATRWRRRAALMTDTECHSRRCSARRGPVTSTRRSPRRCTRTSRRSGCRRGPTPTRRSRKALQHELKVPEIGLATKIDPLRGREEIPDDEKRGGGSDDIGDISWNVPTVTLNYPGEHPGGAGPQLGERHLDGDADRAQRRHLRARRCRR